MTKSRRATHAGDGEGANVSPFARAVIFALAVFCSSATVAQDARSWLQYAAHGLEARAVTQGAACPKAEIDGRETAMTPRAQPSDAFPALICALEIPKGAKTAAIDQRPLALPKPRIDRILLIGDTGCRLRWLLAQDCNKALAWPFPRLAETGAKLAPDLVLHLGDYYYRESACPFLREGCAGSPHGDNWESWRADFFDPARPLLEAAPWVFTRGNHEICARGGRGWTRALDAFPFPTQADCAAFDEPFRVDLGGVELAVLDTAEAEDRAADPVVAKRLEEQFASLAKLPGPLWLAFHKPISAVARALGPLVVGGNKTLEQAARAAMPENAQAILSGHNHVFQALSYADDRPAQIVAGNGGALLDSFSPAALDGLSVDGARIERGRGLPGVFGFALLERGEGEWRLSAYDSEGKVMARCRLQGRKLGCE